MEMTDNVKGVVKKDIHTCISDSHTTNTSRNKKKINSKEKMNGSSTQKELLTKVTHQCISLVAAGTEIITVNVLNSILVVCARPTIYIW
jgi:hypothetical protein